MWCGPNELLLLMSRIVTFGIRANPQSKVSDEFRLSQSLKNKMTDYIKVSHRLVILADRDVKRKRKKFVTPRRALKLKMMDLITKINLTHACLEKNSKINFQRSRKKIFTK